ncbi:hypothetical protein ACP6EW_18035 [Hafnia paralvei]|uniref:hypothetical protein n=1 Tax=Hafnia paralvei TaxID=546367 RepID=UPI003CF2471B
MDKKINWVVYASVAVSALAIGLLFGYLDMGIEDTDRFKSVTIPFLAMLGSWVAGIGTMLAVFVSLWLAGQAKKENVEELDISFSMSVMPTISVSEKYMTITITNKKRIRSNIVYIGFIFSNAAGTFIGIDTNKLIYGKIPALLSDYGDRETIVLPNDFGVMQTQAMVDACSGDDLGVATLYVGTTTNTFEKKLEKKDICKFNNAFKAYKDSGCK